MSGVARDAAAARRAPMLGAMNATTIHLTLELQQRDDSLSGQVVGDHGKAAVHRLARADLRRSTRSSGPRGRRAPPATSRTARRNPVSTLETPRDAALPAQPPAAARSSPPASDGWDAARQAFNLAVDQTPGADRAAGGRGRRRRRRALRPRARPAGRAAAHGPQRRAARLARRRDPAQDRRAAGRRDRRRAADRARRRGRQVGRTSCPRASELGLAALHGSTPDVSVVGYSLGGGVGWYARKHGLSANSVAAIELVTADGELRRVDHEHEPELFWALRGGGGNFGVVTAIEFRAVSRSPRSTPACCSSRGSARPRCCTPGASGSRRVPDEVTSVGRILQFPPIPELPAVPARPYVRRSSRPSSSAARPTGAELLRPLRELGPAMDTFAMVPPVGIAELHMDPPNPSRTPAAHQLLGDLPPEAIDELVAVAGPGSGSPLVSFELRHLGGALARAERRVTARSRPSRARSSRSASRMVFGEESHARRPEHGSSESRRVLAPVRHRPQVPQLHRAGDRSGACSIAPETWERLRAVKAEVDPGRLFRANHSIDPAS